MKKLTSLLILLFAIGLSACSPAAPLPQEPVASTETADAIPEVDVNPQAASSQLPPLLAQGAKQGTYYEIFVRSFADSDGDGVGDFNGLTSKLDYIADMGFTGIWLMPCFSSPSYHGYDVSNYYTINPDFGTMADFDSFMAEADKRGISVILDLVINHSSTQTAWFKQSRAPNSPYRSWYYWKDIDADVDKTAAFFGNKIWVEDEGGYYAALFWSGMPDLNYDSPKLRQEMKNIAEFWLNKGVAGFRLDAAMYVYTTAELEASKDKSRNAQELNVEWWKEFMDFCRGVNPDCYVVGEVWDTPATRLPYVAALDSVFHFDMGETLARAVAGGTNKGNAFVNSMKAEYDKLAEVNPAAIDAPFLSNHDQNRITTALRDKLENQKTAASVLLTLQGLPFVYYGEELGMRGGKPDENIRAPFLWGESDPALCKWMENVYNKDVARLDAQYADPDSLVTHYKRLVNLRAQTPALFEGVLEPLAQDEDAIMSWFMTAPTQKVLVLHNLSNSAKTAKVDGTGTVLFVTYEDGFSATADGVTLPPKCSVVIQK